VSAVLSYDFELAECVPIGLPTTIGLGDVAVFENRQPVTAAE